MKNFFKESWFVVAIIIIVACIIIGCSIGDLQAEIAKIFFTDKANVEASFHFAGFVIGLLSGIVIDLVMFGTISFIISIDDNLEVIKDKMTSLESRMKDKTIETVTKNESKSNNEVELPKSSVPKVELPDVWVCSKCGATNPDGSIICKTCGR